MLTVIQRSGSDLALNVHFHMLLLDGVFDVHNQFTAFAAPTHDEMLALTTTIAERIGRLCQRRALDDDLPDAERNLCTSLARSAARRGTTAHRDPDHDPDHHRDPWAGLIKARVDGFDLECTTVVRADDRHRLEHLCRYVLRPPLADRRLRMLDGDQVGIELKRPWRDGTTWVTMSTETFLERLCSLVPKDREHTVLYRGVLAGRARRRKHVVPTENGPRPKNITWAALMKHGLGLDVLACPCGGRMKLIATVLDKESLARLLPAHGLRVRALPIAPARAPPQAEFDFGP